MSEFKSRGICSGNSREDIIYQRESLYNALSMSRMKGWFPHLKILVYSGM